VCNIRKKLGNYTFLVKKQYMRIFHRWQRMAHNRALNAKLDLLQTLPKLTLDKAKTVAIIFDTTLLENRKWIDAFAQKLQNKGKRVTLFAYLNTKTLPSLHFKFFNRKDVDWRGIPKGLEVEKFLAESYDLLYAFYIGESLPLEALGALTRARFKIGAYNGHSLLYDLMIDAKGIDLQYLISQSDYFLTTITKSQDELSTV
jgi:hypothetical protein